MDHESWSKSWIFEPFDMDHIVWGIWYDTEAYLKDLQYDYKMIFSLNADFRTD